MGNVKKLKRKPQPKTSNHFPGTLEFGRSKLNLDVEVIDINKAGLIFRTYYPLEPGDMLSFNSGIRRIEGIVKWSTKDIDNNYSVGVNFIDDFLMRRS